MKIVVCDDNADRIKTWAATIRRQFGDADITMRTATDLSDLVDALYRREQLARGSADPLSTEAAACLTDLDTADIVVLDSDLSPTSRDLGQVSEDKRTEVSQILRNGLGDSVARQLRSYTTCGLIVVANSFWGRHPLPRVFDLTMMHDAHTHADVNISDAELADDGLWRLPKVGDGSYQPWSRPVVLPALDAVRSSEAAVRDLGQSVLKTLQIDINRLLPKQRDLFEDHEDLGEVTFRQIAYSRLGFRYAGEDEGAQPHGEASERRMAASVVRRWLWRRAIPPQNVLADAPHLSLRYWPLLGDGATRVEEWNRLIDDSWGDSQMSSSSGLSPHRPVEPFLERVVYDVHEASEVAATVDPRPALAAIPELVFAEDTSRFLETDEAEAFGSDLPGPYGRRSVEVVKDVGYEPAPRLLI